MEGGRGMAQGVGGWPAELSVDHDGGSPLNLQGRASCAAASLERLTHRFFESSNLQKRDHKSCPHPAASPLGGYACRATFRTLLWEFLDTAKGEWSGPEIQAAEGHPQDDSSEYKNRPTPAPITSCASWVSSSRSSGMSQSIFEQKISNEVACGMSF